MILVMVMERAMERVMVMVLEVYVKI